MAEQVSANDTYRLRGNLRQKRRNILALQSVYLRSQFCSIALAGLLSLAAVTPARGQANPSVEYQVKAAFVFNFAKFVEWPSDTFVSVNSPIILCVFGYDPLGSALDEIIRGKAINNRAVVARRINELPDLKSCQLVFVSSVEYKHLPEVLKSLKGTSALVVGESDGFAECGGGIQFFLKDKKLRFAVNVDAMQRARLAVSSKLLALAKIVHDQCKDGDDYKDSAYTIVSSEEKKGE
jgi:YfiR/HmsC-like